MYSYVAISRGSKQSLALGGGENATTRARLLHNQANPYGNTILLNSTFMCLTTQLCPKLISRQPADTTFAVLHLR